MLILAKYPFFYKFLEHTLCARHCSRSWQLSKWTKLWRTWQLKRTWFSLKFTRGKRSRFVSIVITDLWSEHFPEVGGEFLLITVVCHPSSACQVGWGWCGAPRGHLVRKWWHPPVPFLVPGPLCELVFWFSAAQKHPNRFPFYIMELFLSSSSVSTCSFCHKNTVTSAAGKKVGWSLTKDNGETCL